MSITIAIYKVTRCAADLWATRDLYEPLWQVQIEEARSLGSTTRFRFENFLERDKGKECEIPTSLADLVAAGIRLVVGTDSRRSAFYVAGDLANFMCLLDEWLRYEEARRPPTAQLEVHVHAHTSMDVDAYADLEPWRYVFHSPAPTLPLNYAGAPPIFGTRVAKLTLMSSGVRHFALVLSGGLQEFGQPFRQRLQSFGLRRVREDTTSVWASETMDAACPITQGRVFNLLETVLNCLALRARVAGRIHHSTPLFALVASLRELRSLHFADDIVREENVSRKRPAEREDNSCHICASRDINAAFIPCGHVLACFSCAAPLLRCPLCRRGTKAYRIFHA